MGERQIFIRFQMCNLNCAYCDSTEALISQKTFKFEETPGKKDVKILNNPATIDQIVDLVERLNKPKGVTHSVSLTGGEPLLQVDLIKKLIPKLKLNGHKIYLETNGTMSDRLAEIVNDVDFIAMDIKLPSMTGETDMLPEHKKALVAAAGTDMFVKIVFGRESKPMEIETASKMIESISSNIPLVLQPVTPVGKVKHGPTAEQIIAMHAIAKRHLKTVKVIPQMHRAMGVM